MYEDPTGKFVEFFYYEAAQMALTALRKELAESGRADHLRARIAFLTGEVHAISKRLTATNQRNIELIDCAEELADLVEASLNGNYKADSFTTQPIRNALTALKPM